jgi:hypothetical protein
LTPKIIDRLSRGSKAFWLCRKTFIKDETVFGHLDNTKTNRFWKIVIFELGVEQRFPIETKNKLKELILKANN